MPPNGPVRLGDAPPPIPLGVGGATRSVRIALPADTAAPRRAREAIRELGALPPSLLEDARLLISEVVSNAVSHAGMGPDGQVELTVHATNFRLRLEVGDHGPGFDPRPAVGLPPADAPGGRGIPLVRRLATCWGAGRDGARWLVWLELRRVARLSAVAPAQPASAPWRMDRRPALVTASPPL